MKTIYPPASSQRLLIISHDVVGKAMAGPGIRYYHLARVLARQLPTTLAMPTGSAAPTNGEDFAIVTYDRQQWSSLAAHVQAATICFLPSDIANTFPELADTGVYLVIDGYDPLLVEWLSLNSHLPVIDQLPRWRKRLLDLTAQFQLGDLFLCASERQRDWWLGMLEVHGRINPATLHSDPSLRQLIDLLPYGVRSDPLPPPRPLIKGVWNGINPTDHLILWGGGLWPWLDPLSAIRAVAQVWQQRQDVKLIFPGSKHPNPTLAGIVTHTEQAQRLAHELGILDKAVFFGKWMPYAEWPQVLQECSLALSLHFDTLETRLAFRSRVLEYIWADLPIISTRGDATSELVVDYQLGVVVDYKDVAAIAAAIHQLLDAGARQATQAGFQQAKQALQWEQTASALIHFCQQPWRAADKLLDAETGESLILASRQPASESDLTALRLERDYWRSLAQAYERGRLMRVLNWMQRTWNRVKR